MADDQETVGDTEMEQENSSEVVFHFFCHICGETLSTFKELEDHIDAEHEDSNETNEIALNNDTGVVGKQEVEGNKIRSENDNISISINIDKGNEEMLPEKKISKQKTLHKCQFCAVAFYDRGAFEKHVDQGHDEFDSQTTAVARTIKTPSGTLKIGKREYLCPFCNLTFTRHFEVLRHMISTHNEELNTSDHIGIANMFSKCDICVKLFTCDSELAIHRNRHTKEFAYICPFCSVETYAEKDAFQHMKRKHKGEKFDKKSILKVNNPNYKAITNTEMHAEKNLDGSMPEMDNVELSPSVTTTVTDASQIKLLKFHDYSEKESVSPEKVTVNSFKCPYCSFATENGKFLNNHVKINHKTTFEAETLEKTASITSVKEKTPEKTANITSVTEKPPETLKKPSEIDLTNVAHYQCQFCSYKTSSKISIVSHLNSTAHSEEKKNGLFKDLDITKLKVNNPKAKSTSGIEKKVNGNVTEVKSQGMKVQLRGRQGEKSSVSESAEQIGSDRKKTKGNHEKIGNTVSKNEPYIKLERMEIPVSLSKSDLNKTDKNNTKDKSAKAVLNSDENSCPYCKFQSKRVSALKFHINFNHNKEKEQADLDKSIEVEVKSEPESEEEWQETPEMHQTPRSLRSSGRRLTPGRGQTPTVSTRKRKHEDETNYVAKKLRSENISASKQKHLDKNKAVTQTMSINVDGTNLQGVNNAIFDQVNHSDNEMNNEDNEMVLYACPYCSKRFKWMKSIKVHVTTLHPEESFSFEDIEVVIEEYKGPGQEPDKITTKKHRRPETEHKEKENELENTKLNEKSKTVLPYSCLFCEESFNSQANAQKHVKLAHERKDLEAVNVVVLDRNSLQKTDNPRIIKAKKINDPALKDRHLEHNDKNKQPSTKPVNTDVDQDEVLTDDDDSATEFFKCPHCEELFKFREDVQEHLTEYHETDAGDESEIVVLLRSADADAQAERPAVDHERFQCPFCPLQLRWKHSILKHARKHHPENDRITHEMIKPVANRTLIERYMCPYCHIGFKWRNSVPRHVSRKHKDLVDEFSIDDVPTLIVDGWDEREDNGGSDDDDSDVDKNGVLQMSYCTKCDKTFGTQVALEKHNIQAHHVKGEPYQCERCPKTFQTENKFLEHLELHLHKKLEKKYVCHVEGCRKSYGEKSALLNHLKRDHDEANPTIKQRRREKQLYQCKYCDIELPSRAQYWRHNLEAHNKIAEKMHECKVCHKAFLKPHDLKDHMFVHMSTADLQCPIGKCLFRTKKIKYLAEHIRRQHNLKISAKTLSKEFLSTQQIGEDELNLFPSTTPSKDQKPGSGDNVPKDQAENGENDGAELRGSAEDQNNGGEIPEDTAVEPDSQLQMLEASVNGGNNTNSAEVKKIKQEIGLKSVITDAVAALTKNPPDTDKGNDLPPVKRYHCQTCQAMFPNHRQLIKHKVAEHIEELERHPCEKCNKTFFTAYDLKEHNRQVHPTSKCFECDQCDKSFAAPSHLQKHMKRHQEVVEEVDLALSEVVCDICGKPLRYKHSLQQHMVRAHPEQMSCSCLICSGQARKKELVADLQNKQYCSLCDKYFCTKVIYQCHMRGTHNTTAKYTCEFCSAIFSKMSQLKVHKHQVHSAVSEHIGVTDGELASTTNDTHQVIEISNEESAGPKFLPKLSDAGLKAVAKELKVYIDEPSAGNKHWKCLLCGACFSKVKYFNMHVRRLHVRSEHQPFRCKLCGAGFARVAEFRKHTRTHSGFRPMTCHICQKTFKQQCHLKEHLFTHGTTRKYKCEICQCAFKQRGALLAHVVKHDKIKPFKCHFCGVGFTIRWSLSKHMKKYLEADFPDTHLCHICHQTFQFFPLLLKHIQTHQEPNPWTCEVCNKSFAAYSSFYDHKAKQKHFLETEYEEARPRRTRKTAEVVHALGHLKNQEETTLISEPTELEEGEMIIDTTTGEVADQPAVEIVIQDQGNGEHTTYKVQGGHTDVDILSIAKQLTEMSGSLGQDIYIEEVAQPTKIDRNEEEERLMMTMLDADEDVKSTLEKTLQHSQKEVQEEERDSQLDSQYMQLLQTVNGGDRKIGKNIVLVQGSGNAEPEYEVVETESQDATQMLNEIGGNVNDGGTESYIIVQGGEDVDSEYSTIVTDSRDQVAAEVLTEFSRNEFEVVETSNNAVQENQELIPDYGAPESEAEIQGASETLNEVNEHLAGEDKSHTVLPMNENTELQAEEIETVNKNQAQDEIVLREKSKPTSEVVEDVLHDEVTSVAAGKNLVEEKLVESSIVVLQDSVENSAVSLEDSVTTTSQKMELDDGSVVYTVMMGTENDETIPDGTKSEETTEERIINDESTEDKEDTGETENGDHDVRVVVTTIATSSDFAENTVITTGGDEVVGESQTEQVEYVVINTDSMQVSQAEGTVVDTGLVEMDEPPILQTDPIGHIQNIEQADGDVKTDIETVGEDQVDTNETSHTLNLIPVSLPEYGSQPMYMFKKADGSMVYISIPEDAEYDNAELINAALEADGYIEEQSNRDLEAAEILKSVAGGSSTALEQVGVSTEMMEDSEHVFQLHIDEESTPGGYRHAVHNMSEAEIESSCKVITNTDAAEGTVAYQCTICNSVLKSKKNLRYHLRRHAKTEDRAFECSHCQKRFVANSELNRHMRVHTDFRPCECKICGKKFRQPGHLMAHTYTHTGERPFECRLCGAGFTTSTLLKNHMMKHTNLRPFKCDYEDCDRAYKTQRELTMHRAVHSGLVGRNKSFKTSFGKTSTISFDIEGKIKVDNDSSLKKQHICYICGKSFGHKYRLNEHIAVHEDRKEFICDVCGLGFNTKSSMSSHAYSHIKEKPEICETCGGAFKNKARLKRHVKEVHMKKDGDDAVTQRLYQCPACGKTWKTRSSIYYHIGSSEKCMSVIKQGQVKEEPYKVELVEKESNQQESEQQEPTVYLVAGYVDGEIEEQS